MVLMVKMAWWCNC